MVQRVVSEPKGTMEDGWAEIPFSEAVEINPSVPLDRGVVYPFVDMASVNADTRSAKSVQEREFQGGGFPVPRRPIRSWLALLRVWKMGKLPATSLQEPKRMLTVQQNSS